MKSRFRAIGMLRAVREKLGRLNRVLMEAGSSDEDLVFHIRKSEWERPCAIKQSRLLNILGRERRFRTHPQITAR
jgi:hypothetical protein